MPLFALDMFCTVLMAGIGIIMPWMIRDVIDTAIPSGDVSAIKQLVGILAFLGLMKAACLYAVVYWGHLVGLKMEYHMRKDLFEHVHRQSFSFFDDSKTGDLMSRVVGDLFHIREFAHHGPEDILLSTILFVGTTTVMIKVSPTLAMLTALTIPVLLFVGFTLGTRMSKYFIRMRESAAELNSSLENSLAGSRVVKAFTNEKLEEDKFDCANWDYMEVSRGSLRAMADFFSSVNMVMELAVLVPLGFGGWLSTRGTVSTGEIVMFIMYVRLFLDPVRRLSHFMEMYQRSFASFGRFHRLMEREPEIVEAEDASELTLNSCDIEFRNVAFSYGGHTEVFKDVNLKIPHGATIAVVGPSGGGKTTLCHLIPRFYEIEGGSLTVDGQDIRSVTLNSLRSAVGIVQQDVFLFDGTIRENIEYGSPGSSLEAVVKASELANADAFIRGFSKGYDTVIGERGVKLSGGQKQRLSLARCFLKDPPILILDEATSALDVESEREVQSAIEELKKGRTTLIIAHRLSTVINAERILVLVDGGIAEEGTHNELLALNGVYSRLYGRQSLVA